MAEKVFTTSSSSSVCGWTANSCCDALNNAEETIAQKCIDSAAEILWALSGRQFGCCELTVRPCRTDDCDPCGNGNGTPWVPVKEGGEWINVRCNTCKGGCSCSEICDLYLPGPVCEITEVMIDGRVLPPTAYRVDNGNKLTALIRPIPLVGDFVFATAFLDPSARFTVSENPDVVAVGIDYGGGVYGPLIDGPSAGIMQLTWRGLDCVTITYDGPDGAAIATARPAPVSNVAGDAWLWPAPGFNFVIGEEVAAEPNDDNSSVLGTLLAGTAVTSNPNPPPLARNITWTDGTSMRFCPSETERFCWPKCQDMVLPATEVGTFQVKYKRGAPLPLSGQAALAEFACELCKACTGDKSCCLPGRVTQVSRQGISFAVLDPLAFIEAGLTGLYLVDAWLRAVNPKAAPRRAFVYSPDMPGEGYRWPS